MLEYIHPPFMKHDSIKYREFCLFISIYTHPILVSLQALSIWIICAFSMHRCRSIIKPTSFLTSLNKTAKNKLHTPGFYRKLLCCSNGNEYDNFDEEDTDRNLLCQIRIKNNFNKETKIVEFYSRTIGFLFNCKVLSLKCFYCQFQSADYKPKNSITCPTDSYAFQAYNRKSNESVLLKEKPIKVVNCNRTNRLNEARLTCLLLYIGASLFLIPQFFEKKIIRLEIEHKVYVFPQVTEFGQSRLFRQMFHLWFYLIVVYTLPFLLIFMFNYLLLRTFLNSRKKCKPYKLKKSPTDILKDNQVSLVDASTALTLDETKSRLVSYKNVNTLNPPTVIDLKDKSTILTDDGSTGGIPKKTLLKCDLSKAKSNIKDQRNRNLTFTLFGVVLMHSLCYLPSIVVRFFYALYPRLEFEYNKNLFISVFTDFSNFLIMLNSSLNFILYIVFGPSKFSEEFSLLVYSILSGCSGCCQSLSRVLTGKNNSDYDCDFDLNLNRESSARFCSKSHLSSVDNSAKISKVNSTEEELEDEEESV